MIAFEMDKSMALQYKNCFENLHDKFIHFIARKDNQLIASSSLFLHNEIAGLYHAYYLNIESKV
jgi:hypothetical protein